MKPLEDRTALVTGAAGGIGRAIARRLAQAGARVVGLDRSPGVTVLHSYGPSLSGIVCDLNDPVRLQEVLLSILATRTVDILINAAGINPSPGRLTETPEALWQEIIETNLTSIYRVSRAVIPSMERGSVIHIASILGLVGAQRNAAYSASKGAIVALTRSMARDHGPTIRVNCICPGAIKTEMFDTYLDRCADPVAERERILRSLPLGRLGCPEDVAEAALFLASDSSAWMTGTCLVIDGGDSA